MSWCVWVYLVWDSAFYTWMFLSLGLGSFEDSKYIFNILFSFFPFWNPYTHRLAREEGRLQCSWASLMAQLVKNLPAMWETWVWSLGWEDPLEKGKATHSNILAWRILWTIYMGLQRVRYDWVTFTWQDLYYPIGLLYCFHFFFFQFDFLSAVLIGWFPLFFLSGHLFIFLHYSSCYSLPLV